MKTCLTILALTLTLLVAGFPAAAADNPLYETETTMGTFTVELFAELLPAPKANDKAVAEAIADLNSPKWRKREAARKALSRKAGRVAACDCAGRAGQRQFSYFI